MTNRDAQVIRLVGSFATAIGFVLLVLTILATFLIFFSTVPEGLSSYVQGGFTVMLALIMASTLIGCGTQLTNFRQHTASSIETLRLNWTALFIIMLGSSIIGLWFVPQLSILGSFMTLILLLVRGTIIRLSR